MATLRLPPEVTTRATPITNGQREDMIIGRLSTKTLGCKEWLLICIG